MDKFYVGQTENIDKRLLFHNNSEKNNIWTKRGIPWELKTVIPFMSPTDAVKAKRLKKTGKTGKTADTYWMEIPNHVPNAVFHEHIIMPNHAHGTFDYLKLDFYLCIV
ncbi:GIY-YIG nuclease family protein [Cyclobacterium qasimii]|uniref:GIY-YIG nuclease family protein n=1 Tax=Cyclobacterium qasimii TaxID=1350429 RepID=UPI0012683EC7|nr:GIY-YIG nuclease family protein [Cyclobacterium qasimii]